MGEQCLTFGSLFSSPLSSPVFGFAQNLNIYLCGRNEKGSPLQGARKTKGSARREGQRYIPKNLVSESMFSEKIIYKEEDRSE